MIVFNTVCNLLTVPICLLSFFFRNDFESVILFAYCILEFLLILAYFFIGRFYVKKPYKTVLIFFIILTIIGLMLSGCDAIIEYLNNKNNFYPYIFELTPPSLLANFSQMVYSFSDRILIDSVLHTDSCPEIITIFVMIIFENIFKLIAFLLGNRVRKTDNGKKKSIFNAIRAVKRFFATL